MQRNSFIQMSKLPNVKGRITYISSRAKQENLYAVYETTERKFWRELAKCNQEEFVKSGTSGQCIEARELIIALPESFVEYQPDMLLKLFTEHFKQKYGAECIAALHHNKRKTNYHIHLIFAERQKLEEPVEKNASRNMFYDENGKHVRTKKEISGESGQIKPGCRIIKKGEVYEKKLFTNKDEHFKSEGFLDEVKRSYTDLINLYVKDEKNKLKVFERGGVYLAIKKIGKNNPKAERMEADNRHRKWWNETVDRALVADVPEQQIEKVKKELANTKGLFKGKIRKQLQGQIEKLEKELTSLNHQLPEIVQKYGYKTVQEFLKELKTSETANKAYQASLIQNKKKPEAQTPKVKPLGQRQSVLGKLRENQRNIKERESQKTRTSITRKDRGAR